MRDDYAVNRSVRGNGKIITDPVDRVSQKFETGDKRNIKFASGKLIAER
jgi:hypothetical protein